MDPLGLVDYVDYIFVDEVDESGQSEEKKLSMTDFVEVILQCVGPLNVRFAIVRGAVGWSACWRMGCT